MWLNNRISDTRTGVVKLEYDSEQGGGTWSAIAKLLSRDNDTLVVGRSTGICYKKKDAEQSAATDLINTLKSPPNSLLRLGVLPLAEHKTSGGWKASDAPLNTIRLTGGDDVEAADLALPIQAPKPRFNPVARSAKSVLGEEAAKAFRVSGCVTYTVTGLSSGGFAAEARVFGTAGEPYVYGSVGVHRSKAAAEEDAARVAFGMLEEWHPNPSAACNQAYASFARRYVRSTHTRVTDHAAGPRDADELLEAAGLATPRAAPSSSNDSSDWMTRRLATFDPYGGTSVPSPSVTALAWAVFSIYGRWDCVAYCVGPQRIFQLGVGKCIDLADDTGDLPDPRWSGYREDSHWASGVAPPPNSGHRVVYDAEVCIMFPHNAESAMTFTNPRSLPSLSASDAVSAAAAVALEALGGVPDLSDIPHDPPQFTPSFHGVAMQDGMRGWIRDIPPAAVMAKRVRAFEARVRAPVLPAAALPGLYPARDEAEQW